jgi:hypothetical protein
MLTSKKGRKVGKSALKVANQLFDWQQASEQCGNRL